MTTKTTTLARHLLRASLLSVSIVLAAPAFAQGARIGFVNSDRMLREAEPAKAAQAKLEQEFSRREKELNDAGNALRAASEKFERDAPTLSESQHSQMKRTSGETTSRSAGTPCAGSAMPAPREV